jgi:tetratricopeptide (TPR) repeat protein
MAPEQIEPSRFGQKEADHRADLYAIGVTLFELLGGRVPFEGETPWEVFRSQVEAPPPDLRALRPDLPPPLAAIITRALAKAPTERYQTARELREALTPFAQTFGRDAYRLTPRPHVSQGGRASGPGSGPFSGAHAGVKPKSSSRTPLIAAGIAALAVVGIVLALIARPNGTASTPDTVADKVPTPAATTAPPTQAVATPVMTVPPTASVAPTAIPVREQMQAARAALDAREYDRAIQLLRAVRSQVVAGDPLANDATEILYRAHLDYGRALLSQDQLNQADGQFSEALVLRPNDAPALEGRKQVQMADKWAQMEAAWTSDDERAIVLLREIKIADPAYRDVQRKLYAKLVARAQAQISRGNRNDARSTLFEATELNAVDDREAQRLLLSLQPSVTPVPTSTPVPPPQVDHRATIGQLISAYYNAVNQRRFGDAYRFWDRSSQQQLAFADFVKQYDQLQSLTVRSVLVTGVSASTATATTHTVTVLQRNGALVTTCWKTDIDLIVEDGQWRRHSTRQVDERC